MGTLAPSLPTIPSARSLADPAIRNSLITLRDGVNNVLDGSNNLDGTKIGAGSVGSAALASGAALANLGSGTVTDAKLASPNNSVYKTILSACAFASTGSGQSSGTYLVASQGTAALLVGAGSNVNAIVNPPLMYFANADFTIGSLTQKLRVRAQLLTNATAPTGTFTFGLYPVSSVAGTANNLNITLGTVVSGSTVAFVTPSASTINQNNSGDCTIPSDGTYALGVVLSGAPAANSAFSLTASLQTRNV